MPVKPCYNIDTGGDILKERANRLYELRKSHNLTQTALSLQLNLSLSRISAYENGENIPCDILVNFAVFYGVSIDYILCVLFGQQDKGIRSKPSSFRTEAAGNVPQSLI